MPIASCADCPIAGDLTLDQIVAASEERGIAGSRDRGEPRRTVVIFNHHRISRKKKHLQGAGALARGNIPRITSNRTLHHHRHGWLYGMALRPLPPETFPGRYQPTLSVRPEIY